MLISINAVYEFSLYRIYSLFLMFFTCLLKVAGAPGNPYNLNVN
ncbi:hypothetical protein DYBT9275_00138 [Dyadobacter sp. CECT 9275]|uniref:Uncharacterized protein n=1 Tax=Dyadobacter helix TaxID=2822344 RepID=A0A916NAL8_9BACT|nr:hypothetical protein DYBT9275_00138 [Dyadobacter sp. CECT 9275]